MINESRLTAMLKAALLDEQDRHAFKFPSVLTDRDTGEPKYHYWLDASALQPFRHEVEQMLAQLPEQFMDNGGGGWSFLNFCQTKDGALWTGLQRSCEELIAVSAALGLADWMFPRAAWDALPGAVPYVVVKRSVFKTEAAPV